MKGIMLRLYSAIFRPTLSSLVYNVPLDCVLVENSTDWPKFIKAPTPTLYFILSHLLGMSMVGLTFKKKSPVVILVPASGWKDLLSSVIPIICKKDMARSSTPFICSARYIPVAAFIAFFPWEPTPALIFKNTGTAAPTENISVCA